MAELTWDGLDRRALAARTGAPMVVVKDTVHSTLDLAHSLGQGGAPSGLLVLAEEQTGGRGRQGRAWHSPRGGIWLTVLLRPKTAPAGGALAIRAGLAAVDALEAVAPALAPRLKWPNDIMVRGAKAGGILCEARWNGETLAWVAVGLGLNVHGRVPDEVRGSAIALSEAAPGLSRSAILAELVPKLIALAGAPARLDATERARFVARAWPPPGQVIAGIEPDGALLVRLPDGRVERRVEAS